MKLRDLDIEKLISLRKKLFELIDREIKKDSHHKSYEGTIELYLANRFEYDDEDPEVTFYIRCYVHRLDGYTIKTLEDLDYLLYRWELELDYLEKHHNENS